MSLSEWKPAAPEELVRLVTENHHTGRHPLVPCGGGTALNCPFLVPDAAKRIDMTALANVIDYPARDMTITVEAGMRIDDLQRRLAAEQQCLPIDVPQADQACIGGALATGVGGPRRHAHGTWRDYVIGLSAVDGQGRLFSAGGRVVKNVAGYDLCKLLIGSWGTLAIITQVTLKLRPLADSRAFLCVSCEEAVQLDRVLETLNLSRTRPVVLDVLNSRAVKQLQQSGLPINPWPAAEGRFHLCIGFEGTQRETTWQLETVAEEIREQEGLGQSAVIEGEPAERLQHALTEFQVLSGNPMTVQATLVPSQVMEFVKRASAAGLAVQAHAGNGIVLAHLPEECRDAATAHDQLRPLSEFTASHQGTLILSRTHDDKMATGMPELNPFRAETPVRNIMRGLKQALDPAGLLSPHQPVLHP